MDSSEKPAVVVRNAASYGERGSRQRSASFLQRLATDTGLAEKDYGTKLDLSVSERGTDHAGSWLEVGVVQVTVVEGYGRVIGHDTAIRN